MMSDREVEREVITVYDYFGRLHKISVIPYEEARRRLEEISYEDVAKVAVEYSGEWTTRVWFSLRSGKITKGMYFGNSRDVLEDDAVLLYELRGPLDLDDSEYIAGEDDPLYHEWKETGEEEGLSFEEFLREKHYDEWLAITVDNLASWMDEENRRGEWLSELNRLYGREETVVSKDE